MELILMVLAPLPLGFFVRNRLAAYLAYTAAHAFVFTIQSLSLLLEWIGGSTRAFGPYPQSSGVWSYALVNAAIYLVGLLLVTIGHRIAARRRATVTPSVSLDTV